MDDSLLGGATAVVTGAATGIGAAIATRLADAGAIVIVADIDETGGRETVESIRESGGEAEFVVTDVTDPDAIESLVDVAARQYGGPDVLVNNAGGERDDGMVHELSPDRWHSNVELNLTGPFLCTRASIPRMVETGGGRIVHVSSANGLTGIGLSGYTASKAGLHGLSRLVATQYGEHGIRSNVVCPGTIDTASRRDQRESDWDDDIWDQLRDQYPAGEFGTPEEVASAVLFLASERSSFVNGVVLPVDGGLTAGLDRTFEHELYDTGTFP